MCVCVNPYGCNPVRHGFLIKSVTVSSTHTILKTKLKNESIG